MKSQSGQVLGRYPIVQGLLRAGHECRGTYVDVDGNGSYGWQTPEDGVRLHGAEPILVNFSVLQRMAAAKGVTSVDSQTFSPKERQREPNLQLVAVYPSLRFTTESDRSPAHEEIEVVESRADRTCSLDDLASELHPDAPVGGRINLSTMQFEVVAASPRSLGHKLLHPFS